MWPGNYQRQIMVPTLQSISISYVLSGMCWTQRTLGLKLYPWGIQTNPGIICFNNSNYAEDQVSQQSISSFIFYVLCVLVSWWSKWQKSVSLSSSEVEYIALSETVKEVMFVIQLLGSMKILVKYPVTDRVGNKGAIFMASNITASDCTCGILV